MLPLIDVTITATLRPEVLKITLDSFFENLFSEYIAAGGKLRFIVNIDPAGATPETHNLKFEQTVNTLYRAVPDNACDGICIIVNTPHEAHFSKAFKWVWSEVKADYVFHLEDDWQLLRPVSLGDMVRLLDLEKDLAALRLSFFTADVDRLKNWNRFFPWETVLAVPTLGYFRCPDELIKNCGMCGHPSLLRGEFVKKAAQLIDTQYNPEKQFHHWNEPLINWAQKWGYGVFAEPLSKPIIRDLGRPWMKENRFEKVGINAFFNEWERAK